MPHTPRETAGVTTRLIVAFVRRRLGDEGVAQLLERSGVPHPLEHLEDERSWSSYDDKVALLTAAGALLDDPRIGFTIGSCLLDEQVGGALRLLIGSLGSPRQVLRSVARAQFKFSTSAAMEALDVGRDGGTVTYRLHPPNRPCRVDCDYTQGILSQVSVLFGSPQATIEHPACQVDGAPECRYVVRWPRRRRGDRFRRQTDAVAPFEADALREQLADLQRTVTDLVSTPDLEDLLRRIAQRAGASVRGLRYLLAVQLDGEPMPRFHSEGFATEVAAALGAELLAGTAVRSKEGRLVSEVRSTQRRYGWLAAELPPGEGFLPTEQEQFDVYAGLAAAALDAATALAEAQERGRTAQALLTLGHELARQDGAVGIAQRVCEAVPSVLGAARSSLMMWNAATEALEVVAAHGFGDEAERALAFSVPTTATDAVSSLLSEPRPMWLTGRDPDPSIRDEVSAWGAAVIATSPVVVQGRLAGMLTALWPTDQPPRSGRAQLLDQLSNLADQASTALSAARSLEQARHQATHDPLTGLANRVLFTDRIEHALADGRRAHHRTAVCFIDLDGFKAVNDQYGHAVGDRLLEQVGQRIVGCVRESDAVARLSGDEFGVLVRGIGEDRAAEVVADKLVRSLGVPFSIGGLDVRIGASLGVAIAPECGATPDQLLRAADDAMYRAKMDRGTYRLASEGEAACAARR